MFCASFIAPLKSPFDIFIALDPMPFPKSLPAFTALFTDWVTVFFVILAAYFETFATYLAA